MSTPSRVTWSLDQCAGSDIIIIWLRPKSLMPQAKRHAAIFSVTWNPEGFANSSGPWKVAENEMPCTAAIRMATLEEKCEWI